MDLHIASNPSNLGGTVLFLAVAFCAGASRMQSGPVRITVNLDKTVHRMRGGSAPPMSPCPSDRGLKPCARRWTPGAWAYRCQDRIGPTCRHSMARKLILTPTAGWRRPEDRSGAGAGGKERRRNLPGRFAGVQRHDLHVIQAGAFRSGRDNRLKPVLRQNLDDWRMTARAWSQACHSPIVNLIPSCSSRRGFACLRSPFSAAPLHVGELLVHAVPRVRVLLRELQQVPGGFRLA